MNIDDMLADDTVFNLHFCTPTTIRNLRGMPISVLRESIKMLHDIIDFPLMASPRLWTPSGSEQTVVVAGKLTTDGKTTGERFGLCVDTFPKETGAANALYLWASCSLAKRLIIEVASGQEIQNQWVPWRHQSERKGANKYCRYLTPIAYIESEKWHVLRGDCTDDFQRFLHKLNGFYKIPKESLQAINPVLSILGHNSRFISPVAIDLHRHPDSAATDTDDVPDKKSVSFKRVFSRIDFPNAESETEDHQTEGRIAAVHRFEGTELFDYTETTPPSDFLPFMNLSFKVNGCIDQEQLKGAGLYGIFFKKSSDLPPKLIYVGLFRNGNKGSGTPFEGNILRDRWVKHIATCSMRGHNVGIGKRTARIAEIVLAKHPLAALGHPDVADAIVRDRGCNAGENRVLFARDNWDYLNGEGQEVLRRFSFSYVRIQAPLINEHDDSIRKVVAVSEKTLKTKFLPICNGETPLGGHTSNVEMAEFERIALALLSHSPPVKVE